MNRRAALLTILPSGGAVTPVFNPLTDVTSGTLVSFWESDQLTYKDVAKTQPATADGDAVKALGDQGAGGHDVTEATNNPVLKTNIVGTMPGLLFDGTKQLATASFASGIGFLGYTLFVSLAAQEAGGAAGAFARGSYDPAIYHDVGSGVVGIYSSSPGSYNANLDTGPHVLTFRRTAGTNVLRLYVDGVLDSVSTVQDVANWAAAVLTLFGNGAGTQGGKGYLFGAGLYVNALNDTERAAVENYLLGKISGFFLGSGSFTYSSSID
jgi:hypothetical protein